MRNATLIAAIAAVLSQKFAPEQKADAARPKEQQPSAPAPRCMGMDCFCGGDCPDMRKEQPHE